MSSVRSSPKVASPLVLPSGGGQRSGSLPSLDLSVATHGDAGRPGLVASPSSSAVGSPLVEKGEKETFCQASFMHSQRPCHVQSTGSRPITEVKQHRGPVSTWMGDRLGTPLRPSEDGVQLPTWGDCKRLCMQSSDPMRCACTLYMYRCWCTYWVNLNVFGSATLQQEHSYTSWAINSILFQDLLHTLLGSHT